MAGFRVTAKARDDLKAIARHTRKRWGREQRNRYLSRIDDGFHTLAKDPEIGLRCEQIRKGYRKYHVGRHLIFYRQTEDAIEIIRILHDRMDVESHLVPAPRPRLRR